MFYKLAACYNISVDTLNVFCMFIATAAMTVARLFFNVEVKVACPEFPVICLLSFCIPNVLLSPNYKIL